VLLVVMHPTVVVEEAVVLETLFLELEEKVVMVL
jgi:hypothetical protein